jgi:hypothetical protein
MRLIKTKRKVRGIDLIAGAVTDASVSGGYPAYRTGRYRNQSILTTFLSIECKDGQQHALRFWWYKVGLASRTVHRKAIF